MVQEIIPGPPHHGFMIRGYLNQQSKLGFLFASQKLRQPQLFSIESAQVSIPLTAVATFCKQLVTYLQKLRYRGIFHAEVKLDPRDNIFKLLEVNPRSGGGSSHPDACGANHILLSYLEAIGKHVPVIPRSTTYLVSTQWFTQRSCG
jgi:predicted ATP-grasp superfamily ATP-dependent carboligase